jgi:hypothetical protein
LTYCPEHTPKRLLGEFYLFFVIPCFDGGGRLHFVCKPKTAEEKTGPRPVKLLSSDIIAYQAMCLSEAARWIENVSMDVSSLGLQAGGGQRKAMAGQRDMFDEGFFSGIFFLLAFLY